MKTMIVLVGVNYTDKDVAVHLKVKHGVHKNDDLNIIIMRDPDDLDKMRGLDKGKAFWLSLGEQVNSWVAVKLASEIGDPIDVVMINKFFQWGCRTQPVPPLGTH